MTETIRAIVFPGVQNLPIFAAEEQGFFEQRNIHLELIPTKNSEQQRNGIADGTYDIAHSAIDNAIALSDVAGKDVISFVGLDKGFNQFVVQPEIKSYEDLRGKILGVDAPDTAFALIAYELLDRNGLKRDRDYQVMPIGATRFRLAALQERKCDFAMLNLPFCLDAAEAGLSKLEDPQRAIGAYQGNTGLALRSWILGHEDLLVRYIASFVQGLRWVLDPANRSKAVELLGRRMQMQPHIAEECCRIILDPEFGFTRDAKLDLEGLTMVRKLRANFTGTVNPKPDADYIDESYYEKALALLQA